MPENVPSERLVDQRLRNRIIEELGRLCDGDDAVRQDGADEWFESFFDYFPYEGQSFRTNSSMNANEWSALYPVIDAMQSACAETPSDVTEAMLISTGWPSRIAPMARTAFDLFLGRGRFSEEIEEETPSSAGR